MSADTTAATVLRLVDTDTINTDGTVTRKLCPGCETPMGTRATGSANPGYYCPARCGKANATPSSFVPANVSYHPILRRVSVPVVEMPVIVYIDVEGGVVQTVYATTGVPLSVAIVDADLEKGLDENDPDESEELRERQATRAAMVADCEAGRVWSVW